MVTSWKISEDASTQSLVELHQKENAPQEERDQAFVFLTFRFRGEVLRKCEVLCKRFGHAVSTAEMIAFSTFNAYAKKGHFDQDKGNTDNYDEAFLLYLLKIAERELINFYRETERKKNSPYDGTEEIYADLPVITDKQLMKMDIEARIEYEVVKGLSKSHRSVYLTYKVHQRSGFKMPRKLLSKLREALGGIKQKTVNFYLKEARDKIKLAINTYQLTNKISNDGKGSE